MSKKTCLLLFIGVSLGQVDVTVTTPQNNYLFGETIPIEVTAINPSTDTVTLNFPTSCQAEYILGSYYSGNHHGCYMVLTQVILPPNTSFTWAWQHAPSDTLLPVGTYNLVGEVLGVGFSDTIQITVSNITTPVDTTLRLTYYPLHIGDRWQYRHWHTVDDHMEVAYYSQRKVTGDTLMPNGNWYYIIDHSPGPVTYERLDTASLEVWEYDPSTCSGNEFNVYSLVAYQDTTVYWLNCQSELFAISQPTSEKMVLNHDDGLLQESWELKQNLGLSYYSYFEGWGGYMELVAANINDIQYGEFYSPENNYFPLELGRSWTYQSGDSLWTETIINTATFEGHLYFEFDHFRDNWSFRQFRWEDNSVRVRIEGDSGAVEDTLYDFNATPGAHWQVVFDPDNNWYATVFLLSKTDTVFTTLGTFTDCYVFEHFIGADYAYIEWFAPGIGLVQRDVITFAGLRRWTLADTTKIKIIGPEPNLPEAFSLSPNYPNPFNTNTRFQITIPRESFVRLAIYDVLGREVAVLVEGILRPGIKEIKWEASNMASGIYFYRLETEETAIFRKMVLLK